ncbi:hypothetical protein EDB80DRAFT_320073 [Ilyonectria destructans]|nr:hypothetical protein EDB80DRAFT_320073 [Ilyonectria destructans]
MWPEQEDCARVFSHVKLVARHWISCRSTAGEEAIEQHVLYNLVEGALLVDGRPIGKLPKDPKKSLIKRVDCNGVSRVILPAADSGRRVSRRFALGSPRTFPV